VNMDENGAGSLFNDPTGCAAHLWRASARDVLIRP